MGPAPARIAKPYPGPESFDTPDERLFFGRQREIDQLIAKILSSRFTLLHAPSGAGKTSLLKAGVLPGLEARGWTPIVIRLGEQPVESVRVTTLHTLLPSPLAEAATIHEACVSLAGTEDALMGDLTDKLLKLPDSDFRRAQLLRPVTVEVKTPSTALPPAGAVASLFTRVLRKRLDLRSYSEHLKTIYPDSPELTASTPASLLLAVLRSPACIQAHSELLSDLYIPVPGLGEFFENLMLTYGRRRSQFGLVLLFDQFEELFTRFADLGIARSGSSAPKPLDWRLRRAFIEEFEALYNWTYRSAGELARETIGTVLPVRLLISLRDEYVANLEPLRDIVGDIDASSYRLGFLTRDQALEAIQRPAEKFGYGYAAGWYADILSELAREERYVEPGPLQIICEKLWNVKGREIVESRAKGANIERHEDFGTAGSILNDFFREFIGDLPSEPEQLEALDLLEPLVTSSRTRNIVERSVLIRVPLRDWALRERLIEHLIRKKIVRQERRLGGDFIEITHEFLIGPILDVIRLRIQDDLAQREFRASLHAVERLLSAEFRIGCNNLLGEHDVAALHANRERIHWGVRITELMLRSVLASGDRDRLPEWWSRYSQVVSVPDTSRLLSGSRISSRGGALSLEEYQAVIARPAGLSVEQIQFMLRNAILRADPQNPAEVACWMEKLTNASEPAINR